MIRLSELYSGKSKREVMFILLAISIISLITAFIIGVADNLPGILLLFLGIIVLIIAFVHHWREKRKFKFLFIFSLLGIPIFIVLHNLLYGLSKMSVDSTILFNLLGILSGISFIMALIICPVGLLIGALGFGLVKYRKSNVDKNE